MYNFYHILIFGLSPNQPNEWLYKVLQIPFHVGVPCFVLISGYFRIHFSFKSLFRLMGMAYFYALVIEILGIAFFKHDSYMIPIVGNVWHRCFEYDSIGMYLNVIFVTIMFSKMQFVSQTVNWIAGSVFSMYLISVSFIWEFVRSTSVQIDNSINNSGITLLACFALSIAFMLFCVVVDKTLMPVWNIFVCCGKRLDNKTRISELLTK